MPQLFYVIGDATEPIKEPAVIAHVVNTIGVWGRGFVMALSKKWSSPEESYRKWYQASKSHVSNVPPFRLSEIQIVHVEPDVHVTNMIAQEGIRWIGSIPPIRYEALEQCLTKIYAEALMRDWTVHMPRIGAVLSGGIWETIEPIIKKTMTVDTVVYTLESQKDRWPTRYQPINEVLTRIK